MAVFYNIVDIASYNAYVLYQIRPPQAGKKVFAEKDLNFYLRDEPPKKKRCYVCH